MSRYGYLSPHLAPLVTGQGGGPAWRQTSQIAISRLRSAVHVKIRGSFGVRRGGGSARRRGIRLGEIPHTLRRSRLPAISGHTTITESDLHDLQRKTFRYFWSETNPENGLLADNTLGNAPASIAGVGMALASYPVAVERKFTSRHAAVARALATLRF